jgi:hypothetical protein
MGGHDALFNGVPLSGIRFVAQNTNRMGLPELTETPVRRICASIVHCDYLGTEILLLKVMLNVLQQRAYFLLLIITRENNRQEDVRRIGFYVCLVN